MNRREFISKSSSGMLAFSLAGLLGGCSKTGIRNPDVVFIIVDDLNNWVGCLGGHPDTQTPNIDRLAKRGVLFTNAHCSAPLCNPSRASLMTGIRPSTSGIYNNFQQFRESPALKEAMTIPQYFGAKGYETSGGGKIFHRKDDSESWENHFPSSDVSHLKDLRLSRIVGSEELKYQFMPLPDKYEDPDMPDYKTVSWAVQEIRKERSNPLFLSVGLRKPHGPFNVPAKYYERFPADKIHLPELKGDDIDDLPASAKMLISKSEYIYGQVRKEGLLPNAVSSYLASISFIDSQIGRLIDAVDSSPAAQNTVIVLFSDNGQHFGEKKCWGKTTPWNESTSVPLIISAPWIRSQGKRCPRPVSLIDVYPTLIDLCGLNPKSGLEGRSLKTLMEDPFSSWTTPALTTVDYRLHSLCTEEWRYIRYPDGAEELYNRKDDPHEWHNLSGTASNAGVKSDFSSFLPPKDAEPVPISKKFLDSEDNNDE